MKNLLTFIIVVFGFFFGFSQQIKMIPPSSQKIEQGSNLQNSAIRDSIMGKFGGKSTKLNKNPDAKIEDYLLISHSYDTIVVDTSLSINKYYKLNFLRKDNFELIPFSNTGAAYNELGFNYKTDMYAEMGAKNKNIAYEDAHDVVYYDLPTPFTELMYRSVFEQGQLLNAVYSVNTSREFNFSISRKGLRSLGNFQNFLTSSSNFKFTANYSSKSKKYYLRSHYSNQRLFGEQNGGISDLDVDNFENGVNQYLDRGVFDPNFENAHNELLGKRFYIDQLYKFHQNDTLKTNKLEVYNSILFEEKGYKFQQNSLDDFFGEGFSNQEINDKIFLTSLIVDAGLNFKSTALGNISAGLIFRDDKYSIQNFELEDFIDSSQSINSSTLYLSAGYSKKIKETIFNFIFKNHVFGDSQSGLIKSNIEFDLKNQNSLNVGFSILNSIPDYNQRLYTSNYINYNWNNDFHNVETRSLNLTLKLKRLLNINIDYVNIQNHIQFEEIETGNVDDGFIYNVKPIQYDDRLDLFKVRLKRSIDFGKFSVDSALLFQKSMSDDIINLPQIVSRNTIYFSTDMFKKALYLQTGFGVKYFSKFYMNGYDPLLAELYIQNDKEIGNFPLIDFFINAKIQQTRLYFKFEHFNSSLTGYNYYSAPNYPYRDFSFRFGLVWNFFM